MSVRKTLICVGVTFLAVLWTSIPVLAATPGVTDKEIKIGQICDLSGPIAFLGKAMSRGAQTYFQYANDQGGINGRKINLLVEDDGYSPPKAVAAAKKLIERDQVFCLFLVVGSAQSLAMYPLLESAGIPLVQPATSNSHIADPPKKYLFLADPNYVTQAKIGVEYILKELKVNDPKVAVIFQDDEPGHDYRDGVSLTCKHYNLKLVAEVPYKRGTSDFSSHVAKLKDSGADLVMMWTLIREPAGIIKEAAKVNYKPIWITSAASIDAKVLELMGDTAFDVKGLYGTGNLHDMDPKLPAFAEFLDVWPKYHKDSKPGFYEWYGWGSAKILVEGIKRCGADPTREGLVKALESFSKHETGVFGPITWTPASRYGNQECIIVAPSRGADGKPFWKMIGPMRGPKF